MARKLIMNLAPVAFEDKNVGVEFFPYRDQDQLRSFRAENRETHFVQRYRGEQIIAVPTVASAPSLDGTAGKVRYDAIPCVNPADVLHHRQHRWQNWQFGASGDFIVDTRILLG